MYDDALSEINKCLEIAPNFENNAIKMSEKIQKRDIKS